MLLTSRARSVGWLSVASVATPPSPREAISPVASPSLPATTETAPVAKSTVTTQWRSRKARYAFEPSGFRAMATGAPPPRLSSGTTAISLIARVCWLIRRSRSRFRSVINTSLLGGDRSCIAPGLVKSPSTAFAAIVATCCGWITWLATTTLVDVLRFAARTAWLPRSAMSRTGVPLTL